MRVDSRKAWLPLLPLTTAAVAAVQFFAATEAELRAPRPGGFPAWGIWGYRVANVSLNLLNYVWFAKIAAKAVEALAPPKKAKARSGKIA